jgi:hypothetical protein
MKLATNLYAASSNTYCHHYIVKVALRKNQEQSKTGRRPAQAGCWQCHPKGPCRFQNARARLAVAVETVLFWHPFCSACRSGIAAHGQSATTPPDPQLQSPTPGCCTRLPLRQFLLNSALAANTSAAAVVRWATIFWEDSLCEAECSGLTVGCCAAVVGTLRPTTHYTCFASMSLFVGDALEAAAAVNDTSCGCCTALLPAAASELLLCAAAKLPLVVVWSAPMPPPDHPDSDAARQSAAMS